MVSLIASSYGQLFRCITPGLTPKRASCHDCILEAALSSFLDFISIAWLANRLRLYFPKRTIVMAKAQCLWDVAIKMHSSIDSTNVLVANLKPLYRELWPLWYSHTGDQWGLKQPKQLSGMTVSIQVHHFYGSRLKPTTNVAIVSNMDTMAILWLQVTY